MSEKNIGSKSKRRRGNKQQKISFDAEIVPKSVAQQFNNPNKNGLTESDSQQKQNDSIRNPFSVNGNSHQKKQKHKKNNSKSEKDAELTQNHEEELKHVESLNSETQQPKNPKRKKKSSQSEVNADINQKSDEPEENPEQLEDQDAGLDPANPVVEKEESKRAQKRKKHQKLIMAKKMKVDLVLQEKSLNYLSRWKHDRNEWKFEKLRQVWLQQNMFDVDRVPERFWETLVEYFGSAKGQIRKTILDEALTIIKQNENEPEQDTEAKEKKSEDAEQKSEDEDAEQKSEDEDAEQKIEDEDKVQRARDIIQSLQE